MPITQGVTYIKINRIDNEGNNNTLTLQQLTNIRIQYSDIGIVDYPVYSIAEYGNYYLYQVYPINVTSSTDTSSLNYNLSVNTGSQVRAAAIGFNTNVFTMGSITSDNLNGYNTTSSIYTFQNTPNTPVTLSFNTTSTDSGVTFFICSDRQGSGTIGVLVSASATSLPISYSGYFTTGEQITVKYGGTAGFTSNTSIFTITSSFNTVIDQFILEPYLTQNFELSNCNPLYGNIEALEFNPLYMDVDYSTNGMIAVNTDQIISGSAYRSNVKPYYYSLTRHINPRYNGSRNIDRGTFIFDDNFSSDAGADYPYFGQGKLGFVSNTENCAFKIGDRVLITQYSGAASSSYDGYVDVLATFKPSDSSTAFITNKPFTGVTAPNPGLAQLIPNAFEDSNIFPLDTYNSNIFEFTKGRTTFPEIPNAGMLMMGNILEVTDPNIVNILNPSSPFFNAYNKIISDTFTPLTIISDIRQYGDGKEVLLNNLQVLTSDFGTPENPENTGDINEYWIPTSGGLSTLGTCTNYTFTFNSGAGAYEVELNELQQYTIASTGLIPSSSVVNNITASLARGNRWFATFYNELPSPLENKTLSPLQGWATTFTPTNDPSYPLLNHGVYEILSGSGQDLTLSATLNRGGTFIFGTGQYGVILWKAITPSPKGGKYVIASNSGLNNLGQGAIVLPDSNKAITQNFNEITTTFGSNNKPPNKPTSSPKN